MADFGIGRQGGSLRDALNQLYPLTNLGGISTGFPPGGVPPRVGMTGMPMPPQAGPPVIPPIPPVPAPTGAVPPIPGAPPNPQDDSAQAQLLGMNQGGPPNYAAALLGPASFGQRFPGPAMRPLGTPNIGPSMDSAFSNINDEYPLGIALREKAKAMR